MKKQINDIIVPLLYSMLILMMFWRYEKIVELKDGRLQSFNISGSSLFIAIGLIVIIVLGFRITSLLRKNIYVKKRIKLKFSYDILLWVVIILNFVPKYHTTSVLNELDKKTIYKYSYGIINDLGYNTSAIVIAITAFLVILIRFHMITKVLLAENIRAEKHPRPSEGRAGSATQK